MHCTVEDCDRALYARSVCKLHYQRITRLGTTELTSRTPAWRRVLDKAVPVASGCLEFSGVRSPRGYGQIGVGRRYKLTHRVVWEHHNGPIAGGLVVRHTCDNPPCVNIDHLVIGTRADNNQDRVDRGRNAIGNQYPQAKLTPALVVEIRGRHATGESYRRIARDLAVSATTVRAADSGRYWGWVR